MHDRPEWHLDQLQVRVDLPPFSSRLRIQQVILLPAV
jgi:hypothetical protein